MPEMLRKFGEIWAREEFDVVESGVAESDPQNLKKSETDANSARRMIADLTFRVTCSMSSDFKSLCEVPIDYLLSQTSWPAKIRSQDSSVREKAASEHLACSERDPFPNTPDIQRQDSSSWLGLTPQPRTLDRRVEIPEVQQPRRS